jgi:ankyrin repeat protein
MICMSRLPDVQRRPLLGAALALAVAAPGAALAQDGVPARALLGAAQAGDLAGVRRALEQGAPIESRDADGRTPLLLATHGNHLPVVLLLIERGADVNAQDKQRDSAFLLAGARGYTEIVRATLRAGANLASTNRYGGTALIPACHHGHLETVRLLLTTPIDVDHVNHLGWTALLEAVILGDGGPTHQQIVRLLLARKAQPNLADREGVTPLRHAERQGYKTMAGLLRAAGGE